MFKKLLTKGLSVMMVAILSLGLLQEANAQEVSGSVVDAEEGYPLPGVNIVIQGTDQGTVTDVDGQFTISVPNLDETLVFSYVGFESQQVSIDGRSTIDVELSPLMLEGEEMVVTAFGIQREARGLTYSTQSVSSDQLTQARELNVVNSLQGRIAGININQSASGVSGDSRVILRGNRSITGDSQPLYVVDGVPVRGSIRDLSPDDIVDIDVLKGPNAAALYGSAAQNGAIVVTTRSAEAGVTNVSVSNTFTLSQPLIHQNFQNEYGQGNEGQYSRSSENSWGPRMEGQMVDHWSRDPGLDGTQIAYSPQPDNVNDFFQTGYNNATNLTASLGGERTQTNFSYTYTDAAGVVPNNEMQRHNVSIRVNSNLTDRLILDSRLAYTRENVDNEIALGEAGNNPMRNALRVPRSIATSDMEQIEFEDMDGNNIHNTWAPGAIRGINPYWTVNRNPTERERERVIAMGSLTYNFSDQLSLMARASYDGESGSYERRIWNTTMASWMNGHFQTQKSNALEWNGDVLLSYAEDLSQDWSVEGNVGASIQQQRNSSLNAHTDDALIVPNFFTLSNSSNPSVNESIGSPMDTHSVYAFGQLGWRDAIYLDLTGRNDWSSTLPADNWSYFYPSAGLSFIVSDLMSMPEAVSLARVRFSFAEVGNSASPFNLTRGANFTPGGRSGYISLDPTLPAENLRPERTRSYEIGLDVRFLQGRLGLDVTAYQMNTTDQLFTVNLPVGSGASSFYTNGGNVENKGIEFSVNATPVQTTRFQWDMNTTFDLNRNMVVEIDDERPRLTIASDFLRDMVIEEGEPFGQVYSRGFVRNDDGAILIGDDGMPQVTSGQTVQVANFSPDWSAGFSSSFSFGNVTASFLIDHRQGGTVASITNAILYSDGVLDATLPGRDGDLVFGETVFSDEDVVMASDGSPNTTPISAEDLWVGIGGRNAPVGEAFVDSATNTRLRELTIGYNFTHELLDAAGISNMRVSAVGRNLFFIYKASENLDPDLMVGTGAGAEGFESFTPPTTRSVGFNVQVDF